MWQPQLLSSLYFLSMVKSQWFKKILKKKTINHHLEKLQVFFSWHFTWEHIKTEHVVHVRCIARYVISTMKGFFLFFLLVGILTCTWSLTLHRRHTWRRWSTASRLEPRLCIRQYRPRRFSRRNHPCRSRRICQWDPRRSRRSSRGRSRIPVNGETSGASDLLACVNALVFFLFVFFKKQLRTDCRDF